MTEKELILESLQEESGNLDDIPFKYLIITLSFIAIILLIVGPKIYLTNNIYYESLDFNKQINQYDTLKEENLILKQKLEKMNFENDTKNILF